MLALALTTTYDGRPAAAATPHISHRAPTGADYATFFGMATPPTSYGGYGGNANETPKCVPLARCVQQHVLRPSPLIWLLPLCPLFTRLIACNMQIFI
jgi:hypothetical protein